ncbi:galactose oxidase [Macroventuria anomochaeta]|uniref:Galactose oxidase n=1 Tax=Macroventuria anomochaeta TaxID=301207 RepID=A0ACB6RRY4_9PLEO|nr:galactose oxidase [Macroventuria anomochaeta]KAF2624671.1 galactose oxidase [Macroventuria anomochaeta]
MAAEVAAGAYIAAEAIEHTAEAGYAAYIVSKPTLPLKATFSRIATTSGDHSGRSLERSHHTLTVVNNKAYIFGGITAENKLASNEIHAVILEHSGEPEMDYNLIPAIPSAEGERVPDARASHAACAFHGNVAVYGGCNEKDELLDEKSSVWMFSPERKTWEHLAPSTLDLAPGPRRHAKLFAQDKCIVLFGGYDGSGDQASDIWQFDIASKVWWQLPTAPVATTNVALANNQLWLISGSDPMSSQLYHLDISSPKNEMSWDTFTFPTNPMAPGPRARQDGALLPIHTGYGRNYLIYLLGARADTLSRANTSPENPKHTKNATQWSDTWALQIPSSDLQMKASTSFKEAIKPAKIKDAIRSALGADTHELSWGEAVVQVPSEKELEEMDGKLHPGPRAFFGADVMHDEKSIAFWGGVDAKGERVGDGWVIRLE